MFWLLIGLFGLSLVPLSAALSRDRVIIQRPRFYGMKPGHNVIIYCECEVDRPKPKVDWVVALDSEPMFEVPVREKAVMLIETKMEWSSASLFLANVTPHDSGVYYCKVNDKRGPGTGLQVMKRPVNVYMVERKNKVKDALILLQTLMLASCIAAPLVQKYMLGKKEEAIHEDAPGDHTYEGLVGATCEGDLYEDISDYAQTGGPEAPWN